MYEQCIFSCKERESERERERESVYVHIDSLILFNIYFCTAGPLDINYNFGGVEHMSVS